MNYSRSAGRYAPSPSGDLHLGNLRTALLAWAYARSAGLDFLIRVEDLDERSRPQFEESQLRDLEVLGIQWNGTPIRQSDRLDLYSAKLDELRAAGFLYECYCTRKELAEVARAPHHVPGSYPGTCRCLSDSDREVGRGKLAEMRRGPALRLRVEIDLAHGSAMLDHVKVGQLSQTQLAYAGEKISLPDLSECGDAGLTFSSGELRASGSCGLPSLCVNDANYGTYCAEVDDFVIRRGDGVYSYNFVSVVDDGETGVAQIVRGDDLLPSTPRQVYLQRLLGYSEPEYRHVPLVLNAHGVRLAKRDGAVTLSRLASYGWQPEDVLQLLAESLGYSGVRSAEEFAQCFDPERLASARLLNAVGVDGGVSDFSGSIVELDAGSSGEPASARSRCQGVCPRDPWMLDVVRLEAGPREFLSLAQR